MRRGNVDEGDAGLKETVIVAERKDGRLSACVVEGGDGWVARTAFGRKGDEGAR